MFLGLTFATIESSIGRALDAPVIIRGGRGDTGIMNTINGENSLALRRFTFCQGEYKGSLRKARG
jgi:hypothetical protein